MITRVYQRASNHPLTIDENRHAALITQLRKALVDSSRPRILPVARVAHRDACNLSLSCRHRNVDFRLSGVGWGKDRNAAHVDVHARIKYALRECWPTLSGVGARPVESDVFA
jgi:hypothetical protein